LKSWIFEGWYFKSVVLSRNVIAGHSTDSSSFETKERLCTIFYKSIWR
jgi:hypothetical protein